MTLRGEIKAAARALGVWYAADDVVELSGCSRPWVLAREGDGFRVLHFEQHGIMLDDLTAALLLLGHARGLRVDLSECPACRKRGSKHEEMFVEQDWLYGEDAEANIVNLGWAFQCDGFQDETDGAYYTRPCPACTIDGKATGRHTVTWVRALLDAMDSPASTCSAARCGCETKQGHPGDPDTREALAVLADKVQAAGDPLGLWLAAWLRGSCLGCDGHGRVHAKTGAPMPPGRVVVVDDIAGCARCHGHGTVLAEHEPALLAALEPLTWIRDRMPQVGDDPLLRHVRRLALPVIDI